MTRLTYKEGLKHGGLGVGITLTLIYTAATITGVSVYRMNQQPYSAVSVEIVKVIASEARAQCDKMRCKEFTLKADGLQVGGNVKK